ncbi:MAG: AEC family transporter [Deltaproteobacteria bacterium]|nr:AEC family transporter [Deltaproteobacteria bacterium]
MHQVVVTIIPIFMLIFLGAGARRLGFMEPGFTAEANRLVFHLAIPALVFRALTRASLREQFDFRLVLMTMIAVLAVVLLTWLFIRRRPAVAGPVRGTFSQAAIHGNLGYIGLAVAFYYLDEADFAQASMLVGFLMLIQNCLAVLLLNFYGQAAGQGRGWKMFSRVVLNPVILAATGGMVCNLGGVQLPVIADRFLKILSGLALPMGLLLIGATLSPGLLRRWFPLASLSTLLKLVALPGLGLLLYRLAGLETRTMIPGLILLAAPTATLTFVMAQEMGGEVELAVAAVSFSTIVSAFTYALWLGLLT